MNIEIDIQCCRTCLEATTANYLLHNTDLKEKIETITSTVIEPNDGLPLYFCITCYNKLEVAYQFRKQSLKACKALNDYITKVKNQFNEIFKHKAEVIENDIKLNIDDESDLYEFESIETVTLQNKNKILSIDLPFVNENEIDLDYAIENINQISDSYEKQNQIDDQLLNDKLNERIKKNVVKQKNNSLDVEVAKVQFGSRELVKCEKCEKTFKRENLIRHMAAHTGESRFKCHICNKNFTQKTGLNRHMLIHTGERPYECEKCGKKFSQSKSLKFHMTLHGVNTTFSCSICRYKFIKPENLEIHMKEKHSSGIQKVTHICEYCKKSFKLKYSLNAHIKKIHKDEVFVDINFGDVQSEDSETE